MVSVGSGGGGRWVTEVAVVACLLLGAVGCSSGDGGKPPGVTVPTGSAAATASSSSTPSSTSGESAIDITTKPSVVTVAYADAVMDELDRILSDAIREFVAADGPTQ